MESEVWSILCQAFGTYHVFKIRFQLLGKTEYWRQTGVKLGAQAKSQSKVHSP